MSPESALHNMTLDMLYKMVREKRTNAQIRDELARRRLPPLDDEQLGNFRGEFRAKEIKFPDQMRVFRRKLGVK